MRTSLLRLVGAREGELGKALTLTLYCFAVTALIIGGKTTRDAFFLSRYDKSLLPLMFVAVAVCVSLLARADAALAARLTLRTRLVAIHCAFAISLLGLNNRIEGPTAAVFYVWMEVINVWSIMQFWTVASEMFDPRQARRLFGPIGAGGSIAGIALGFAIPWWTQRYGSDAMLGTLIGFLTAAGILGYISLLGSEPRGPRVKALQPQTPKAKVLDRYVLTIAAMVCLASFVTVIIDYQFKIVSSQTFPDETELIGFFGRFHAYCNILTLLVQLVGQRLLLTHFGVVGGLAVIPLAMTAPVIGLWMTSGIVVASLAKGFDQVGKFTVMASASELLWMPVAPVQRDAAKPLVKGSFKLIAEAAAGLTVFIAAGFISIAQMSGLVLTALAAWLVVMALLRKRYAEALTRVVRKNQLDLDSTRAPILGEAADAVVESLLASEEVDEQLVAIEMIEGSSRGRWSKELRRLLASGDPRVRRQILLMAGDSSSIVPNDSLIELIGEGSQIAAAAAGIAASRELESASPALMRQFDNPDAKVRAACGAAVWRLDSKRRPAARELLAQMILSDRPEEVAAAVDAAPREMGLLTVDAVRSLLKSETAAVPRATLRYAGRYPNAALLPDVLETALSPKLITPVRATLRSYSSQSVVDGCEPIVTRYRASRRIEGLLRVLADYPTRESVRALLEIVESGAPRQRRLAAWSLYQIASGLEMATTIRSEVPRFSPELIRLAYRYNRLLLLAGKHEATGLLEDYFQHCYLDTLAAWLTLRLLSVPKFPVRSALDIIDRDDRARKPFVIELLENSLPTEEFGRVAPLFDAFSVEGRDREAARRFDDLPQNLQDEVLPWRHSDDKWLRLMATSFLSRQQEREADSAVRLEPDALTTRRTGTEDDETEMYSLIQKTILLRSVGLFRELSAESVSLVAEIASEVGAPAGTAIFEEGQYGDSLYAIASGTVRVHSGDVEIAVLGPKDCFGEMAILDGGPRSASVTALEDSVLFQISQDEFLELMASYPEISRGVMKLLTGRLRKANERLATYEKAR